MLCRRILFAFFLVLVTISAAFASHPRLVVVISLDQFPYEYLPRFQQHFGPDGFKLLMQRGANFTSATYKHAITLTGPGHAVILTGAYGATNGIVMNSWYDRERGRNLYCVGDDGAKTIGGKGGGRSPANLIGSTVGDELRIASGFRSRVISISHKDRAAILLGGKLANEVFWMSESLFVTSSYYADSLPGWVQRFNRSGVVNSYFGRSWTTTLPPDAYAAMDQDDAPYEAEHDGLGLTFPHVITGSARDSITRSFYSALLTSPFGNEVLLAFAKEALRAEDLGKRGVTDLLAVSFSSTDYVGHAFGPHSREALDMIVRTDRLLAQLLKELDRTVGLKHCVIALTSDHGVSPIPEYLNAASGRNVASRVPVEPLIDSCSALLNRQYGAPSGGATWFTSVIDFNIYLNPAVLQEKHLTVRDVGSLLSAQLSRFPAVASISSSEQILVGHPTTLVEQRLRNSFFPSRSGDLLVVFKPYAIAGDDPHGATHGYPYDYAAHVPLMIMGEGIRPGTYTFEVSPADLAPTLSVITGSEFPPTRQGRVLHEILK